MCGIAGRILRAPGPVGRDLVELMDAQVHRGADSTGFALYGAPRERGYIVRAVGMDRAALGQDLEDFRSILRGHGSDLLEDPTWDDADTPHVSVRMVVEEIVDLARWSHDADGIADRFEVQSVGRSLEVVKDLGDSSDVADKHGVRDFVGTHGLGHARLATESSVLPTASHPFWARPFPDVAIVHNGQITDYYLWRNRLRRRGVSGRGVHACAGRCGIERPVCALPADVDGNGTDLRYGPNGLVANGAERLEAAGFGDYSISR